MNSLIKNDYFVATTTDLRYDPPSSAPDSHLISHPIVPALTDAMCRNTKPMPDGDVLRGDGDGLYLRIRPGGARVWIVDYVLKGKRRKVGIGNYDPKGSQAETVDDLVESGRLSLAQARYGAAAWKALRRDGRDRVAERASTKAASRVAAATEAAQPTLREVVERFMGHISMERKARARSAIGSID